MIKKRGLIDNQGQIIERVLVFPGFEGFQGVVVSYKGFQTRRRWRFRNWFYSFEGFNTQKGGGELPRGYECGVKRAFAGVFANWGFKGQLRVSQEVASEVLREFSRGFSRFFRVQRSFERFSRVVSS